MQTVGKSDVRESAAEELERVLASEYFRNSKQAERLLRYLVTNSFGPLDDSLRERVIGEKVFGRPPKYDSNSDSIVRVWANHLRKRLAQFYQAEGRNSRLRFVLRPGSYRIEFQPVAADPPAIVPPEPVPQPAPSPRSRPLVLASAFAGALAIACLWLAIQNLQLRRQVRGPQAQPPLNLLWSRLFGGKLGPEIVLADSNFSLFQALLHKPVTLQDYIRRNYLFTAPRPPAGTYAAKAIGPAGIPAAASPDMALVMARRDTSTADVDILRRTLLLAGSDAGRLDVTFARDFPADNLKTRNVILVGSTRANPWVDPLEAHLNFRFDYNLEDGAGVIVNSHPGPGEQASYSVPRSAEETAGSYGMLAFQPNLSHSGNVLIIAGLGVQGTLAAGELATSPELFKQLVGLVGARDELPYFEVVLKAGVVGGAVHGLKIVAWRSS